MLNTNIVIVHAWVIYFVFFYVMKAFPYSVMGDSAL